MIIVTGAAGFIGSCLVQYLNEQGHYNLILVDEFESSMKRRNLINKGYIAKVHRNDFEQWIKPFSKSVDAIFHLGARTDTTEKDTTIFDKLNVAYSKMIWSFCVENEVPLIYASSAATFGMGEHGFEDSHDIIQQLKPLNPYGVSKNDFDAWALKQEQQPPFFAGLKFFNVYGPNEYHKGRMASVIFHTFNQIKETGGMKLFRSHNPEYKDGEQSRDFIYVKDVVAICYFLFKNKVDSGIYNVGTGKARSFWDLATNTFKAQNLEPNISFIDTPEDIRDTYQYFTEASMEKLKAAGYDKPFYSLEEGVQDYVSQYLANNETW